MKYKKVYRDPPFYCDSRRIHFINNLFTVPLRTSSITISIAFIVALPIFLSRVNENTNLRAIVLSGPATPIHTVPTGFSTVPPVGPAIPEVETA